MSPVPRFLDALARHGLLAILRGLPPADAAAVGAVLYRAGFRLIEVPLNSPEPLRSIRILRQCLPADALVGAGTVLQARSCLQVAQAGAELVVMPHADAAVIRAAKDAGLACVPGVATPTEAFAALAAGADALKMFPAEVLGSAALRAWRAVLPGETAIVAVGGVTARSLPGLRAAGASGVGLGSVLYRPGDAPQVLAGRAAACVAAWQAASPPRA